MQVQSLGREDAPEEEIAAHCSILTWKSPWTEEPGKPNSSWGHKESDTTEYAYTHMLTSHKLYYFYSRTCILINLDIKSASGYCCIINI